MTNNLFQTLCVLALVFVCGSLANNHNLSPMKSQHMAHVGEMAVDAPEMPLMDANGNTFITIEFLNSTELINRPTSIWANYSQSFMAIGNLDGSVVRMTEETTELIVPPNFGGNGDDEHAIFGVTGDFEGNIYFSQFYHCMIRKVDVHGHITEVAGIPESEFEPMVASEPHHCGYTADGNIANGSALSFPGGLQFDYHTKSLLFSDHGGLVIRKFSVETDEGVLMTIAGKPQSQPGFSGDGGVATDAELGAARYFWLAPNGDVFIADALNHRIRVVSAATGIINSLTGEYRYPYSITGDMNGFLYTSSADPYFFVDRTSIATGEVVHFAGTGLPPRYETFYGLPSNQVPISNASFLYFEPQMGLLIAQEDVMNILLVAPYAMGGNLTTHAPTAEPTEAPTLEPSLEPTVQPSVAPTHAPTTLTPSLSPDALSTTPTFAPTFAPTAAPTVAPSAVPTVSPSTLTPSRSPTAVPVPTRKPTAVPTVAPSRRILPVVALSTNMVLGGFTSTNLTTAESDTVRSATGRMLGVSKNSVTIKGITIASRRKLAAEAAALAEKAPLQKVHAQTLSLNFATTTEVPVTSSSTNLTEFVAQLKATVDLAVSSGDLLTLLMEAASEEGVSSFTVTVEGVTVTGVTVLEPTPEEETTSKKDPPVGIIVGSIIGGGVGVLLLLAVMVYFLRGGDNKVVPVSPVSAADKHAVVPIGV